MHVKNLEVVNNKNIINVNSLTNNHICPICKTKSDYIHSTYIRKIQDTPIHNMETWLYIETKEFECINYYKSSISSICENKKNRTLYPTLETLLPETFGRTEL